MYVLFAVDCHYLNNWYVGVQLCNKYICNKY